MIKPSTIQKRVKLKKETDQRGHDIKLLIDKLAEVTARADMLYKENIKLKSHWLYRFINWFR